MSSQLGEAALNACAILAIDLGIPGRFLNFKLGHQVVLPSLEVSDRARELCLARVAGLVSRRVSRLAEFRMQVLLALGAEDTLCEKVVDGANEYILPDP
ncbi:hypothetical protein OG417_44665 [Actinoallomurus sp. NBC_01490]|uniref:hypothetical protein n=1 Tax=Actinoallomurus sp. NBC_01490 TaxID=2903557 RepID=UPI002E380380|nr:hypothetical protein [Actinoallomurus sp. NBC_01490]